MARYLDSDDEVVQRRLQRLEGKYRRAQILLAGVQAIQASLQELPTAEERRKHAAIQQVQAARQTLLDIQTAIDQLEDQVSAA